MKTNSHLCIDCKFLASRISWYQDILICPNCGSKNIICPAAKMKIPRKTASKNKWNKFYNQPYIKMLIKLKMTKNKHKLEPLHQFASIPKDWVQPRVINIKDEGNNCTNCIFISACQTKPNLNQSNYICKNHTKGL